jgi:adenylate cyclase
VEVERGFAFIDLSGFTAYTDTHGVQAATRLLGSFRQTARDIASRRGVRIAKWLGDGAMMVSVEPRSLLEAALEAQEKACDGLLPRIGATYGTAILFEGDDYVASTVNLAARLCDLAPAGQVLVSEPLIEHLPPWAAAEAVRPMTIRGFSQAPDLYSLRVRQTANAVVDPTCGLRIPRGDSLPAGEDGPWFCSEACLESWHGAQELQPA